MADRTISLPTGNARTVAGLMIVAVIFSVVGAEIKSEKATSNPAFSEPFIIIAGGTVAAALLSVIAEAGDAGRRFAIGLSALAAITATLVNGGPVWAAFNDIIGAKNTGTTKTTTATTPTGITSGVTYQQQLATSTGATK